MSLDKILFYELRLLSRKVAEKDPFFKQIACLGKEEGRYIVYCRAFKRMNDDEEFNKFLDKIVIPFLRELGMVNWQRDVITEMGLRLGEEGEEADVSKELGRK